VLKLDAIQTLALGGLALLSGAVIRRRLSILERYNIPTPVIGGLLVATAVVIARSQGITLVKFDTTLQSPLMIAFFTSVGFSASPALLRSGGPQMMVFLALASVFAIVQNFVGAAIATAFGLHPLFGVLSGSVTLAGGPATGLAFAPLFEQAGVHGAATIAIAVAMAGIVAGSVLGGPIATILIERYRLQAKPAQDQPTVAAAVSIDSESTTHLALKNLIILLVAMGIGSWISRGVAALDFTFPAYVGAMMVGACIRTLDDYTGWIGLSQRTLDTIGSVCLSLFLAVALMTLNLWELSGLALPLAINLLAQIILIALSAALVFRLMGRDYDAAVMSGGFIGFMLGTTANAVAVMRALVERYGMAPRAFLVAPIVGAFFIDFTNALIITTFVNVWR
jgi:ESS family glutamate:Na+ symporter